MSSRLITALFFAIACFACTDTTEHRGSQTENTKSELAIIMREMETHGDAVKKAIAAGNDLPERPEGLERILQAEPTPGMDVEKESFPIFARQYLENVDALYSAKEHERPGAYNALIQSCSNCHQMHCPGPLVKINKMYLKNVSNLHSK